MDPSLIHYAKVHYGGTLMQTRTDRWETPNEVRLLKMMGGDATCAGRHVHRVRVAGRNPLRHVATRDELRGRPAP